MCMCIYIYILLSIIYIYHIYIYIYMIYIYISYIHQHVPTLPSLGHHRLSLLRCHAEPGDHWGSGHFGCDLAGSAGDGVVGWLGGWVERSFVVDIAGNSWDLWIPIILNGCWLRWFPNMYPNMLVMAIVYASQPYSMDVNAIYKPRSITGGVLSQVSRKSSRILPKWPNSSEPEGKMVADLFWLMTHYVIWIYELSDMIQNDGFVMFCWKTPGRRFKRAARRTWFAESGLNIEQIWTTGSNSLARPYICVSFVIGNASLDPTTRIGGYNPTRSGGNQLVVGWR